jgi:hypothetical protein
MSEPSTFKAYFKELHSVALQGDASKKRTTSEPTAVLSPHWAKPMLTRGLKNGP